MGLGVDFGMLLYGSYQSQRNAGVEHEEAIARSLKQLGEGIIIGALTTAAAFISFLLSGCSAFAQLGGLIAIGILIASVLMMTLFYACVSRRRPPEEHDMLFEWGKRYVAMVFRNPKPVLISDDDFPAGALRRRRWRRSASSAWRPTRKTLEPTCDASAALHTIQAAFPAAQEPLLVLVDAKDAEGCHDAWTKIQRNGSALRDSGRIKSFLAPTPFVLSPERARENLKQLAGVDLAAARASYTKALATEGFNAADPAFQNVFKLIDALETAREAGAPQTSGGRFSRPLRAGGLCWITSSPANLI